MRFQDHLFRFIHSSRLIYNTCWEDPRLDRRMLGFGPESRIVVITSAGDNALDYLLDDPREVCCVDLNPRQNALLELKLALFRAGSFTELDEFFGQGGGAGCAATYSRLRSGLPEYARRFWDENIDYFRPGKLRPSFYHRGAAGRVAWIFARLLGLMRPGLRRDIARLMDAKSLEEQAVIYREIEPKFWNRISRWFIGRPSVMAMLGVPGPQIKLIEKSEPGGLAGFVMAKMRQVFTELPIWENYFWQVYFRGAYAEDCRPLYLRPENFELIASRISRIKAVTGSLSDYLRSSREKHTHFILLDHQDWLAWREPEALREEWELILANSAPGAKILLRSAGLDVSFLPDRARTNLRFYPEITAPLHRLDRVGTYGSQHLAVVS